MFLKSLFLMTRATETAEDVSRVVFFSDKTTISRGTQFIDQTRWCRRCKRRSRSSGLGLGLSLSLSSGASGSYANASFDK